VDAVERVIAEHDGETQTASIREAVERVERSGVTQIASVREAIERVDQNSREDLELLNQRFGQVFELMNERMRGFVGALNEQLGAFAHSLTEKMDTRAIRDALVGEIQTGVTPVVDGLRERIDWLEKEAQAQVAAVRSLETRIGRNLEGLTGAFERLVGAVETLERWWGDPNAT
jgi:hypothetical protein